MVAEMNTNGTMNGTNGTNGTLASNQEAMERFLARLRESGNVRASCDAAGVPRRTAYNWRGQWATFAKAWDDALDDAVDILEATAWKRAVKEQSDRLLMFLLKAHRPEKYKDRVEQELVGKGGGEMLVRIVKGIES